MLEYEIVEAKEILHEVYNEALAEFARVMQKKHIDLQDSANEIVKMRNRTVQLFGQIYGKETDSMEAVFELKEHFFEICEFLKQVHGDA